MKLNRSIVISLFSFMMVISLMLSIQSVSACSRILWNPDEGPVVCARTMDWGMSFEELLVVYPRGVEVNGQTTDIHAASWTSKYGSVVSNIYGFSSKVGFTIDDGACDGINEKGLAVHILMLRTSQYEERDHRPGISYMRWGRYILDNFSTVQDAVDGMESVQITPVELAGEKLGVHMAIEDATGDSAVIEFINGELSVHHGKEYVVMTNDPAYDKQLARLKQYNDFEGQVELPGKSTPESRFTRASYYLRHLNKLSPSKSSDQSCARILSVIHNVAIPLGAPYQGTRNLTGDFYTWWTSVTDSRNRIYYFKWAEKLDTIQIKLDSLDFSKGNPVKILNPRDKGLSGDVTHRFRDFSEIK